MNPHRSQQRGARPCKSPKPVFGHRLLARLAGIARVSRVALSAWAQENPARNFPSKPIRIIVGYAAGGGNDIVLRLIAPKMAEGLGQPVIVENKPGAQSIVAAEYVAKAAPDGYTLLMGASGPIAMNPATYSKLSYSPLRVYRQRRVHDHDQRKCSDH